MWESLIYYRQMDKPFIKIKNGRVNNMRKVSKDGTLPLNEELELASYYCVH